MKRDISYDAILFDLDNTLYDYTAYWIARLSWSLEPVQAAYPQIDITVLIERAIREQVYAARFAEFLRREGVDDEAACLAALERYRLNFYEQLKLYPDTIHVLTSLRREHQVGLITNGPARTQRPKIAHFGLEPLMDVLLISEEVACAKPDPAIFDIALQRLGVPSERALYVGDSLRYDLAGAHAAGLDFIWMNPTRQTLPPATPPPHASITHLSALLTLLDIAD